MICHNGSCPARGTDKAMVLIHEREHFCHECTECGSFTRVKRLAYEDTVKRNKGQKNDND